MAQQRENPIHWDQNAAKWNLTLIFSLVVGILGIFMSEILLIALGLGMAAYSWFTTPRQFLIYRDTMVIVYGIPRSRVISFAEISHIELLALPLGERLRIRMVSGSRLMLMMRDPGAFRGHLEDALARYHGEQTGAGYADGAILSRGDGPAVDSYMEPEHDDVPEGVADSYASFQADQSPDAGSTDTYSEPEYTEAEEVETYSGGGDQSSRTSGSYIETPEPDFSGEGRPAYDANVELETDRTEEDPPDRPRSPY